jgi:hypothetical protein
VRLGPLALLAGLAALIGCGEPGDAPRTAEDVIARARAAHGADVLDHAAVAFTFRGDRFAVERDGGRFAYARETTDSTGAAVRDVLTNDGLTRTVAGDTVALSEREALIAEEAVNSVVYFFLLPYPLADPAVRARIVGADTLRGEPYDRVEVTFEEEGGGRDYQDVFLYWFHRNRTTMDFFAYSYEDSGGGARFRQAVNPRTVGGVRVVDHLNFEADPARPLGDLGRLWEADSLGLLSEIVHEDAEVRVGSGPAR